MKKYLITILVLVFIGCGGGSSSPATTSPSAKPSSTSDNPSSKSDDPSLSKINITAVDGYIKNALVKDALGNKASYTANGKYAFDSTPTYPLTLTGGKLEDTNATFDITMTAQSGSDVISPITTFLGNDSTLLSKFANLGLGISTLDEFTVDYVNSNNLNLSKLSQLLYVILKDKTLTTTFKANIDSNEGSLDNLFVQAATDINNSSLSPAKKVGSKTLLDKVKNFSGTAASMENFISNEKSTIQDGSSGSIIHNGLTYGTITSTVTGKTWLDRNLGTTKVCTAHDDSQCFGDYYQWGRDTDGHEKSNSPTTSAQATNTSDVGHGNFIIATTSTNEWDWALAADVNGSIRSVNWNPCPSGYRIPTINELLAENIDDYYDGFNKLKFPAAGRRGGTDGVVGYQNSIAYIWSSSPFNNNNENIAQFLDINSTYHSKKLNYSRSGGLSVRCFGDPSSIFSNVKPTANAGGDQTVSEGTTVTLDASDSSHSYGSIVSYQWKEGSAELSTAQAFDKTDFSVGTHTITLTVTDNNGLTATDTLTIKVIDDHGYNISTSTTINSTTTNGEIELAGDEDFFKIVIADPGELELFSTGSSNTQGYLYNSSGTQLEFNDDGGTNTNFNITYDVTAGTYYLKVKLSDSNNTGSYSITKNFITDRPSISSSSPSNSTTDVGINSIAIVTFNEEIEESSFSGNITFKDSSNNNVAFTTTYSNKILKIIPDNLLNITTSYTISFSSNIQDLDNNDLIQEDILFTTSASNTIVHNGITYGFVNSTNGTGKIWLDRNVGASSVCTAYDDSTCFGDYYQWGRETDGHEKASNTTYDDPIADFTSSSNFIVITDPAQLDWTTSDSNGSIRSANWSKTDGSSICPVGFRVPTISELEAETINLTGFDHIDDAYASFLKFPSAGGRSFFSGSISSGTSSSLWTTTPYYNSSDDIYYGSYMFISNNINQSTSTATKTSVGFPVRCLRD